MQKWHRSFFSIRICDRQLFRIFQKKWHFCIYELSFFRRAHQYLTSCGSDLEKFIFCDFPSTWYTFLIFWICWWRFVFWAWDDLRVSLRVSWRITNANHQNDILSCNLSLSLIKKAREADHVRMENYTSFTFCRLMDPSSVDNFFDSIVFFPLEIKSRSICKRFWYDMHHKLVEFSYFDWKNSVHTFSIAL